MVQLGLSRRPPPPSEMTDALGLRGRALRETESLLPRGSIIWGTDDSCRWENITVGSRTAVVQKVAGSHRR